MEVFFHYFFYPFFSLSYVSMWYKHFVSTPRYFLKMFSYFIKTGNHFFFIHCDSENGKCSSLSLSLSIPFRSVISGKFISKNCWTFCRWPHNDIIGGCMPLTYKWYKLTLVSILSSDTFLFAVVCQMINSKICACVWGGEVSENEGHY